MQTLVMLKSKIRAASARHETLQGQSYLVAPVVMITEGVHEGSAGPLYYPADELAKTPASWNAKPIVLYHPDGPTATDRDVLESRGVGTIMNTKYEDGKLKAEAWLLADRIDKVDPRIREFIENKQIMEVSTGLFTDLIEPGGVWNGEEYEATAINYRPDHLALLPDMVGACSVEDGAGLLRNANLSVEDWLALAPAELRDRFREHQRAYNDVQARLIGVILANEQNDFSEKALKAMPLDELSSIARLAQQIQNTEDDEERRPMKYNYSGQATTNIPRRDDDESFEPLPLPRWDAPIENARDTGPQLVRDEDGDEIPVLDLPRIDYSKPPKTNQPKRDNDGDGDVPILELPKWD